MPAKAARVAALGWHIQFQMDGRELHTRLELLQSLPRDLVIEHIGKFLEPVGVEHPGFQALLRLLDGGRCWVKLSGAYMTSKSGPPLYADVGVLAKALVRHAPERMLWASNWPHPMVNEEAMPRRCATARLDAGRGDSAADFFSTRALYGFTVVNPC